MTQLDDALVPGVLSLLARLGKTAVIHDAPATPDVATGRTSGTPDSWTVKVSPPSSVTSEYVRGDVVRVGDVKMLLAASGLAFTPVIGQCVVFDSTNYRIVEAGPIYSGEQICAWRLFARR